VARNPDASYFHGEDGLGNSNYPPSRRQVANEHAVNALIRLANESPGKLVLAAIGPLTNVALATRLDPTLPQKYKRLVVMGGAIRGMGNTTATVEFNMYTDPEAAAIVFDAWPGLTLISWETTMSHSFAAEQTDTLLALDTPRAEFFRRISQNSITFNQKILGGKVLLGPDLLAVAAAIEPDIVLKAETHCVQVELAGNQTRGQTSVDWFDQTGNEPNVNLALGLDTERLWELLLAAVQ
jgi:purine nucleosidase